MDEELCSLIVPSNTCSHIIQFLMSASLQQATISVDDISTHDMTVCNSIWNSSNVVLRLNFLSMCSDNEFTQWWRKMISILHYQFEKNDDMNTKK